MALVCLINGSKFGLYAVCLPAGVFPLPTSISTSLFVVSVNEVGNV